VRTQRQSLRGLMSPRPLDQLIVLLHRQLQLPQNAPTELRRYARRQTHRYLTLPSSSCRGDR
jgi:hypothetical protein